MKYFTDFIIVDEETQKNISNEIVLDIMDKAQEFYDNDFRDGELFVHDNTYTVYVYHPKSEGKIDGIDYGISISKN